MNWTQGKIPHFVQEDRAAVRQFEPAFRWKAAPVNAPFS
jgi:hypothetical protein